MVSCFVVCIVIDCKGFYVYLNGFWLSWFGVWFASVCRFGRFFYLKQQYVCVLGFIKLCLLCAFSCGGVCPGVLLTRFGLVCNVCAALFTFVEVACVLLLVGLEF